MAAVDDWRALYPFASHEATIDGWRYHYLDEGAGDPLLFVHGNPTWSFYWRNLILGLRAAHRCLAVDHIGCGLSDKPQQYPYTLEQHILNLVEWIEQLDLSGLTLVAHDWGGAIGLGAALAVPHRFARFVLCNTGAFPPPFIPWRIRLCRLPWIGEWAMRGPNLFAQAALTMATEHPGRLTPAVQAGLLAPYDSWENRVAIARFVQDIPTTHTDPTWRVLTDIEEGLPGLSARPFQFFWGMKDWCFTPECLERFLTHLPDAEVHRFEDAGHYVVEDAHERIVPLLRDFVVRHPIDVPAR